MSAQPVERDLPEVEDQERPGGGELAPTVDAVEVRRNATVGVVIGGAASAIAIAYLWRAVETSVFLDWFLCVVMAGTAFVFLRGLLDARTPLFVADEMGVRVRLGVQWRGLPWEAVDRVVVKPRRGLLHDGRVVVTLYQVARTLEGLDARGRRAAGLNRRMYGAPLAVPLGLTTRTTGGDQGFGDRIAELAAGRTEIVTLVDAEPSPVVPGRVPTQSGERSVIDDDSVAPSDRRPRWMRRSATVAVNGDVAEAAYAAPPEADVPAQTRGRAVPFLRGRSSRHDVALPEAEAASTSSKVRPMATVAEPVAPLVIDDFQPQPAYDPVIGPELAAARTRVGLSVDQLAERTRIRPHVIESIEVDDFAPCGGDFYARGHIRTLARVLGKDPEPMLAHFENRYADAPISPRKVFEAELATGLSGSMRRTVGGPNWALLIGVVLTLVLAWSLVRLFAGENNELVENPPPVLDGSAGLGNVYGEPAAPSAPPPVETVLTAVTAGTHVEVRDGDGALVYEGDLVIGESKTVRVDPPVTVSSDNAGALRIALNGEDLGFLGDPDVPGTQTYQRPSD